MAGDHWKQSNGNYSGWDSDPISKPGRFAGRPPIVRLARGFRLSRERRDGVPAFRATRGHTHTGRRHGFRLSPERRDGVAAFRATRGHTHTGGGVDSGFRRKDGLGWRHLGRLVGKRTLGGDVDSGFRRKDGLGGGVSGDSWANGHWGATWIPAFAGKTGWAAASPATRGHTHTGGRRGFRLSLERRVGRAGSFETGGRAAGFGMVF